MKDVTAIVPAAGLGRRAGGSDPKQGPLLGGMPILTRTLLHLTTPGLINALILVVPPGAEEWCRRHVLAPYPLPPIIDIIPGGAERQGAGSRGPPARAAGSRVVVIHDAVRPFVSADLLESTIDGARRFRAAVAAVPAVETGKGVEDGVVGGAPARGG